MEMLFHLKKHAAGLVVQDETLRETNKKNKEKINIKCYFACHINQEQEEQIKLRAQDQLGAPRVNNTRAVRQQMLAFPRSNLNIYTSSTIDYASTHARSFSCSAVVGNTICWDREAVSRPSLGAIGATIVVKGLPCWRVCVIVRQMCRRCWRMACYLTL